MKQTEIKFIELPNEIIKITDFKNIAKGYELEKEFGKKVVYYYFNTYPNYDLNNFYDLHIKINSSYNINIKKGMKMKKEDFTRLIKLLKQSGKNLKKAIMKTTENTQYRKDVLHLIGTIRVKPIIKTVKI